MKRTQTTLSAITPIILLLLFLFTPAQSQPIPDFQVNENASPDGSEQSEPDIAGDGNGNYVVTWKDKRNGSNFDIYAQIYSSAGTASGPNFKVSQDPGSGSQYRSRVAVDPNLNFVITWIDKRSRDWDIYAQRFSSDGSPLGDNFKVNEDTGTEEQEHPGIFIDGSGNFTIVWADERDGDWDIYLQRYASDGTALGGNIMINEEVGESDQYWPACACNNAGDFVVTWADDRYHEYENDIYIQRFSSDGTPQGGNVKVNTDSSEESHLLPTVAVNEQGDFVVAWSDRRHGEWDIYAQRYLSDGTPVGDNYQVNETIIGASHHRPSIGMDQDGNFVISWDDSRHGLSAVYAQRYSADGAPIDKNFMVYASSDRSYHYHSQIMVDNSGDFTIAWEGRCIFYQGDIFGKSFLSDGTPAGSKFKINDDIGSENQFDPYLAKDDNDNFIIAWVDHRDNRTDLYAQRYSSDGTELGSNFRVNEIDIRASRGEPRIATAADGNFIIAWSEWDYDYYRSDIYAQRYSHDGTALGGNFRVSYLGANMNYGPSLACRENGEFVIAWADAEDGSFLMDRLHFANESDLTEEISVMRDMWTIPDIFAQRFSRDGTPLGDNFQVNDDTGSAHQTWPAVAIDHRGICTIVWQDERNGEGDLYCQRYSEDGTALGGNYRIEGSELDDIQSGPAISADGAGNLVIAWPVRIDGNYTIYARRLDSDGSAIGESFRVNAEGETYYAAGISVSANEPGNFIVAWSEVHNGYWDVYAQRYLSSGDPLGVNFQISNVDEMSQYGPIVALGDSRIFTVWEDNRGEQTGYDIWANVLDWDNSSGVGDDPGATGSPASSLFNNHPNPFNPTATIEYRIPERGHALLEVYNIQGQRVAALVDQTLEPGAYRVVFDASNLNSGVYFYRLQVGDIVDIKRTMLLR